VPEPTFHHNHNSILFNYPVSPPNRYTTLSDFPTKMVSATACPSLEGMSNSGVKKAIEGTVTSPGKYSKLIEGAMLVYKEEQLALIEVKV
jgi:hypothetical protein